MFVVPRVSVIVALTVLPEPQVSLREAAYNYFYERVIMT